MNQTNEIDQAKQTKTKDWVKVKFISLTDMEDMKTYANSRSMELDEFLRMAGRNYIERNRPRSN